MDTVEVIDRSHNDEVSSAMIDLPEDPVEDVFLEIGDKIEPIHAVKEEIEEESIPSIKDVSGASRNLLESPIVTAEKGN